MFLASLLESSSPVGLKPAKFWSRIIVLMFKASQQWSRQKLCMRRLIPIASLPTSMFACCWYQTLRIQSFPVASVRNPSLLLFLFWDAFFAEFVLRLLPAFSFWIDTSTGYQLYLSLQKVELKLLSSSSEVWFGFFFPLSFYLLSFIPPWFDEEEKKKKIPLQKHQNADQIVCTLILTVPAETAWLRKTSACWETWPLLEAQCCSLSPLLLTQRTPTPD